MKLSEEQLLKLDQLDRYERNFFKFFEKYIDKLEKKRFSEMILEIEKRIQI